MRIETPCFRWSAAVLAILPLAGYAEDPGGRASPWEGSPLPASLAQNTASISSPPGAATIHFSGYTFEVRSGTGGPGPNRWSNQNVWVDAHGYLHLKLANNDGKWSAAEIYTTQAFGYGTFQFKIIGQLETLNQNVVLGLFTYPVPAVGPDGTNEIDIEFSRWGGRQANEGNWTIWPAVQGSADETKSFDAGPNAGLSTHRFRWTANRIAFQALSGLVDDDAGQYASWTFAPSQPLTHIPQSSSPLHMNLWLYQGLVPSDGKEAEVVISEFKYVPEARAAF